MPRPNPKNAPHSGPAVASQLAVESIVKAISVIGTPEEQEQKMPNDSFDADLIVIGAGPGGYVAAIRAAQLGAKVICVEKEYLGGTCLNWGCIPSKAMIGSVERLQHVQHADKLGVKVEGTASMDFEAFGKRRDKIVQTQRGGVGMLFKKNGVRHVEGFAAFKDKNTIEVSDKDGKKETLRGKNFLLAMGSGVIHIPIPGLEGGRDQNVWTSDDAVTAPFVPKSMLIVGGGAVGCEFSYVFNGLGTDLTVVEMMPNLIPFADTDLGVELGKLLGRQGIKVKTGANLEKVQKTKDGWKCFVASGGKTEEIDVQVVLLGVGRKAMTDNMNLEKIGVKMHKRGVEVDDTLQTSVPNIYAIGDVTGRIQLAHVASMEGIFAVTNIVRGENRKMEYKAVPNCVYTIPEVATVGLAESEAKTMGYDVVVGKANFRPFGKPMAIGEQDGFVKIVADRKYGEILGVHMIGPHVTDMIAAGVAAIRLEATLDWMTETIHAHPTLSEVMLEAYEDATGHAIHKL
ncbi:MAG TPA: dihydrolipoyl dehydrogenase [Fimbriimonadaceae bacterium]|nr:dihydrolipoyl dehydrogenase [Fimbriimonadaceae bacterium]